MPSECSEVDALAYAQLHLALYLLEEPNIDAPRRSQQTRLDRELR